MKGRAPANLVGWLAAIVLLSALAAWVTARLVTRHHHHEANHAHRTDPAEQDLHAWMHDQLDIRDEQLAALQPFEESFEQDRARLRREIEEGGLALAAAIRRGDRRAPEIKDALARVNRAQAELQEATLDHFFVMKEHLDPDQAERLIEWTHESITRQHRD